jgi:signal transduction histidine kinase
MDEREHPPSGPSEEGLAVASGLIHEMRHPLLGIKAGLELLALQIGAAVTSREEWRMVTGQVARMEELFRTYQELFRHEPEAAGFELEPVVRRAVDLLRHRVDASRSSLSVLPGPPGLAGRAVPQALVHVLTNLIVNALDATEAAGTGRRVEVRVLPPAPGDRFVELRVSDEGTGIAAEDHGRIFAPFFTTKGPGKGTGLGLHLARRVLTACGGELQVVAAGDPDRAPWACTEFAVRILRAEATP